MHSMHSLHSLLPSISKRACRGLTSNFQHWHSAVLGGNTQPKSHTPSPKHCQFSDLLEMCSRRAASGTDMGTLWCGAACDAIFSSVFHASAGASRHRTGLTRRAQQAANMVISQFCRWCASVARAASAADLARVLQDVMPSSCLCSMTAQRQPARHQSSNIHSGIQTLRVSCGAVLSLGFRVSILGF